MDDKTTAPVDSPTQVKAPATELLNSFMKEHKIQIVFGDMKIRQVKDGAIIVEKPPITAEYV